MNVLWSEWTDIDQPAPYYSHAVYQLRFVDSLRSPLSIPRFLGTDPTGCLYIGECTSMEQRRTNIITGIKSWDKHVAGILIHILGRYSEAFRRQHRESCFQYRFEQHASEESRTLREERLIKDYVILFGEVPPLNSAIPKRHGDWKLCENDDCG